MSDLARSNAMRRPNPSNRVKLSLAEAQSRPDIVYRSLHLLQPKISSQPRVADKPIPDFHTHMLETHLIPLSLAATFEDVKYRGI
ncbi:hypothetical protein EUX98_g4882 [Antrodiella citrinella]|uniref:Uncharacterized protein n=1 Tax=Antrodiella citrinella TaxID=2447956 RepID=A0A4S4N0V0_9APHY|nr:hypothetical protein EUX98_g4882 [Antrodiella citrinella]